MTGKFHEVEISDNNNRNQSRAGWVFKRNQLLVKLIANLVYLPAEINPKRMEKKDWYFILLIMVLVCPFIFIKPVSDFYTTFNREHGMYMSFIKFAILATLGETIALRIRRGVYNEKGFGILPRILVWGFLGLAIKTAFVVFSAGTPAFLEYLGLAGASQAMKDGFSGEKLLVAFCISVALNTVFAPLMMTFHKITDIHILRNGGTLSGFVRPVPFAGILQEMNWDVQWNFVFGKTIPFFWIPAHTITFLLPAEYQVLFAAFLGLALGLILALAGMKGR